jgi:acetolactate synthase small subunit
MTCRSLPMTLEQKSFLECIRWSDAAKDYGILVVDIDFNSFSMNVMGEHDVVSTFSDQVRQLFFNARTRLAQEEMYYGRSADTSD